MRFNQHVNKLCMYLCACLISFFITQMLPFTFKDVEIQRVRFASRPLLVNPLWKFIIGLIPKKGLLNAQSVTEDFLQRYYGFS